MTRRALVETEEDKAVLVEFLRSGKYPQGYSKDEKRVLRRQASQFVLRSGTLYRVRPDGELLPVIFPFEEDAVRLALLRAHQDGHPGVTKMLQLISEQYYGIPVEKVREYVSACDACRQYNAFDTIRTTSLFEIRCKYDRFMMDCVDLKKYRAENDGHTFY